MINYLRPRLLSLDKCAPQRYPTHRVALASECQNSWPRSSVSGVGLAHTLCIRETYLNQVVCQPFRSSRSLCNAGLSATFSNSFGMHGEIEASMCQPFGDAPNG